MAANVETLSLPSAPVRRLFAPEAPSGRVAASFSILKQRLLEPRLPRMSGEWLDQLQRRASYRDE